LPNTPGAATLIKQIVLRKNATVDDGDANARTSPAIRERRLSSDGRIRVIKRWAEGAIRRDVGDVRIVGESGNGLGRNGVELRPDQAQISFPRNATELINGVGILTAWRRNELDNHIHLRMWICNGKIRSDLGRITKADQRQTQ